MLREKRRRLISGSIPFHQKGARVCVFLWLFLSACGGNIVAHSTITLSANVPSETPFISFPIAITPTPTCVDGLIFLGDATIPDYSMVSPSITLDKQWLVRNSGSCNWDSRYRLRLIGGESLGTFPEQALFPIRAGMQATLQIVFTAPLEPGEYFSQWQAFDPMGIPFGESFLIRIIVQ